ncbi:MAG: DUF3619 family protein [Gallionella sp.]|nr:DUF3619 family protein [Gallionella sp.]
MKKQLRHRGDIDSRREYQRNQQRIAQLLTRGTEQLDEPILASLRHARARALQKQRVHEPVFSFSAAGVRVPLPHTPHQWIAATILLAAIVIGVTGYWQSSQDHQNLDLEILTDDLPIEIFVDQ